MPIIFGLLFFVCILIIGSLYWVMEKQLRQRALVRCLEMTPSIIAKLVPDPKTTSLAQTVWLSTLSQRHYLDKFNTQGALLIFGSIEMGRATILRYIAQQINSRFARTRTFSIYLDISSVLRTQQLTGNDALGEAYRSIIWNLVAPFSISLNKTLGEKDYHRTGLASLTNKLRQLLINNIAEIPYAKICTTVMALWRILGIERIRICLDGITTLDRASIPHLLTMMIRTFGQSGKAEMIIGGESRQIKLQSNTPNGVFGMQIGHDILLAIDLEELLIPEQLNMDMAFDVRMDFLAGILAGSDSTIAQAVPRDKIMRLFHPPDTWKYLFEKTGGNLEIIAKVFVKLAEYSQINHGKVTRNHIDRFLSE